MRSVLVTRPQPVADEFAEKLRQGGFYPYIAPMMEYAELPAEEIDLTPYQALVFTSAQAVQIFSRRFGKRDLPVLAVGDATAAAAKKAGFAPVYSAEGDSEDVVQLIRAAADGWGLRKALHVCSDDTAEDVAKAVATFGVRVTRLPVYKAQFIESFPAEVLQALRRGVIDVVTLFSARTAANFMRLMEQEGLRSLGSNIDIVCISPRVAEEVNAMPWRTVRIARRPSVDAIMEILQGRLERRERVERRQNAAAPDERGYIAAGAYQGPDRRTGRDRREIIEMRQQLVAEERMRFINRAVLGAAFMFTAVVASSVFLLAPEYARLTGNDRIGQLTSRAGASFNEALESARQGINNVVSPVTDAAMEAVQNHDLTGFSNLLANVAALGHTPAGDDAIEKSVGTLRGLLAQSSGNVEEVNSSIEHARRHDKALASLLRSVDSQNLAEAAVILTLNSFKSNVTQHRPFADDLTLLQKLAGNDSAMGQAMQTLAPYAAKGVTDVKTLQSELNHFAAEIIAAKIRGEDVSLQEAAVRHVQHAQALMARGNVTGAMGELRGLQGENAQRVAPWMSEAQGYVTADAASDELTQGILQAMSGDSGGAIKALLAAIRNNANGGVAYISPSMLGNSSSNSGAVAP